MRKHCLPSIQERKHGLAHTLRVGWPMFALFVLAAIQFIEIAESSYCTSLECVCGQDCHNDAGLHSERTGAPTSDEYFAGIVHPLPAEFGEDEYEYALTLLGGG